MTLPVRFWFKFNSNYKMVCHNKKIILSIFVILLGMPFVIGLNGGDDYLYYFEHCKRLEVNITGDLQIDDGEYILNSACDIDGEDYWICNCTDDWYFNLTPLPNTINNYSIFLFGIKKCY